MSHALEISDDDDSFEMGSRLLDNPNYEENEHIYEISSDEDDIEEIKARRQAHIQRLFPMFKQESQSVNKPGSSSSNLFPKSNHNQVVGSDISSKTFQTTDKPKIFEKMVGGVKVQLPVDPYGCQTALMFKVNKFKIIYQFLLYYLYL